MRLPGSACRRSGEFAFSRLLSFTLRDAVAATLPGIPDQPDAAAASAGLRLWTFNRRDYPMPDLAFHEPES